MTYLDSPAVTCDAIARLADRHAPAPPSFFDPAPAGAPLVLRAKAPDTHLARDAGLRRAL